MNRFFSESKDEVSYGGINLQPLIFQDDISRMTTSVWAAQSGNNIVEAVIETKLLDFNLDKSCYIVMGSRANKTKIDQELKANPLTLCGKPMENVTKEKYLGNMISCNGLAASVEATVKKRKGQVFSNILEVKAVVEDYRANVVGGITTGLEIWELAIVPFLMNNCETLVEIAQEQLIP